MHAGAGTGKYAKLRLPPPLGWKSIVKLQSEPSRFPVITPETATTATPPGVFPADAGNGRPSTDESGAVNPGLPSPGPAPAIQAARTITMEGAERLITVFSGLVMPNHGIPEVAFATRPDRN